jgi:hypothetical protein
MQVAAEEMDDAARDREAEAEAAMRVARAGRLAERLEDLRQVGGIDATAPSRAPRPGAGRPRPAYATCTRPPSADACTRC